MCSAAFKDPIHVQNVQQKYKISKLARPEGFEPSTKVLETPMIPFHHRRIGNPIYFVPPTGIEPVRTSLFEGF